MGFSKSDSESESSSRSFVWDQQIPFFRQMYGAGQNLMNQQLGQTGQAAQGIVGGMMPQLQQSWQNIMSPGDNPMVSNYAAQLGRDFQQQILPGISRGAQGAGQLGGSRQGVAEGLAAQGLGNNLAEFAGNQYNQDMNRMLAGIGQAQNVLGFGMSPYTASWLPLQMMGGLLGRPTVLQEGSSESDSSSFGISL